jgi:hypothetical protein
VSHNLVVADESGAGRDDGWAARCSCGWDAGMRGAEAELDRLAHRHSAQGFFADLDRETRSPHFGEHHKTFVRALLLRAQEAGLFTPDKEQS